MFDAFDIGHSVTVFFRDENPLVGQSFEGEITGKGADYLEFSSQVGSRRAPVITRVIPASAMLMVVRAVSRT